jgi:hypothetical protein
MSGRFSVSSVPAPVRDALRPRIGPVVRRIPGRTVRWGNLRRQRPFSAHYGRERGEPVDRRYIDGFMDAHSDALRGEVLEIREPFYARRAPLRPDRVHVADIDPRNPRATMIADLTVVGSLPPSAFDCAIITQTLQFLGDVEAALANLRQALRPGGTLLVTVPCLGKIDHEAPEADRWRWTPTGLRVLLERSFPRERVQVRGYGNLVASLGFLLGLAQEDLSEHELDRLDPTFPLVACGRVDRAR